MSQLVLKLSFRVYLAAYWFDRGIRGLGMPRFRVVQQSQGPFFAVIPILGRVIT